MFQIINYLFLPSFPRIKTLIFPISILSGKYKKTVASMSLSILIFLPIHLDHGKQQTNGSFSTSYSLVQIGCHSKGKKSNNCA